MRNIIIESLEGVPVEEHQLELLERKGLGHPDSICDAIMEEVSVALCRAYTETFGRIMHHNIISRNPDYFSATLMHLGLGLAGGSWLIVAFAIYWFIVYQWAVTLEGRFCMERCPEEFAEYKRKVAKNFLIF